MAKSDIAFASDWAPPFEFVKVEPYDDAFEYPERYRARIAIDTVHDGDFIPSHLLDSDRVAPLVESGMLWRHYIVERDWGANSVAAHVARFLGLPGYNRVRIARVLMDFNRFPGSTPPEAGHFERLAINEPFSACLNHQEKRYVLEKYYDAVSTGMENALHGKLIKLGIHTYDVHNRSRTQRPAVSLVTRSESYQLHSRMPFGLFDPLFPDALAESSVNSILRDRISLTLEKSGVHVEHNYPYCLPDGSLEIRCQPWLFFQRLKGLFVASRPETESDPVYQLVWEMLLNTNLRHGDSEWLSGYMHRFRKAPQGREHEFADARKAYEEIGRFIDERPQIVDDFRQSPNRPSAFSVEVRKDLVWDYDGIEPVHPNDSAAKEIARTLAHAVAEYLRVDRPAWDALSR